MKQFSTLTSHAVLLPVNDIDTDQIIPARFLKVTDKAGLGASLFADWRYQPDGSPNPDFVLNKPESQSAQILVTGHNFGCGSSREHAPWALMGFGFQAIISTKFADIFRNNALKNGLLPVTLEPAAYETLIAVLKQDPQTKLTIDLAKQIVSLPDGRSLSFPIDAFSKTCLLNGMDELEYLLSLETQITAYEQKLALSG
jgi:3-isopropylmalate/(R)-2-methylmalate dehydratase small subunit